MFIISSQHFIVQQYPLQHSETKFGFYFTGPISLDIVPVRLHLRREYLGIPVASFFYMSDVMPVVQPQASKYPRTVVEEIYSYHVLASIE